MRRASLLLSITAMVSASSGAALAGGPFGSQASPTGAEHRNVPVCAAAPAGYAACDAVLHVASHPARKPGRPAPPPPPANPDQPGYDPADLWSAYGLPGSPTTATDWSTRPVVAIVDAYDDPNAEQDLQVYRSNYGLPTCSTSNGCFRKVNQAGGTKYPRANGSWAMEISLDMDMVSAACPTCRILLVEASTPSLGNLGAAVDYAAGQPGVAAISNSYGASEFSSETSPTYDGHYTHPGIAVTASTGDDGYGVQYPAASAHVVAVGGTSLTGDRSAAVWTETAWSGAGSGCSAYVPKPSWQTDATSCANRAVADVSAVADPDTGVAVYDSYAYNGYVGWLVVGGTSASSPIVASVFAEAGVHTVDAAESLWTAAPAGSLRDVTSGTNSESSCTPQVWCTSGDGWDGPTGLGTPNGTGAF